MSELTLKSIEQLLDDKLAKQTEALDTKLGSTEAKIIKRIDDAQEELARIIADTVALPFTARFEDIERKLDITERVQRLEKQMTEMRTALHLG